MPKESSRKRRKILRISLLLFLSSLIIIFFSYHVLRYFNPAQAINFTILQPTKLPESLKITKKELAVWSDAGLSSFIITSTNVNIHLGSDSRIMLFPKKHTLEQLQQNVCSVKYVSCNLEHVGNLPFILSETKNSDGQLEYTEANFIKDNTRVLIHVDASQSNNINWPDLINSFEKVQLKDYEIHYYHPGP